MHTAVHTLVRNGSYYLNLRVPQIAQENYGKQIRFKLGDVLPEGKQYLEPESLAYLTTRLTALLEDSFQSGVTLNYREIARSLKPKKRLLTDFMEEYLSVKCIQEKPTRLAIGTLLRTAGNRDVAEYSREDVRALLLVLRSSGSSTGTVRRRINSISAVFNYAYAELDIEKRNPFSRVLIAGEGTDAKKRGTFTKEQLINGYSEALRGMSKVKLLMPILGETGCRMAEVVGLRVEDIDLEIRVLHIRPHALRRLKTAGSERSLPLMGCAEEAVRKALMASDGVWLFPQYCSPQGFMATHASNALNKWLKSRFDGLTAHSLRHSMRDRLRAVECPLEAIDQIGGWSSVGGVGTKYGQGYKIEQLRHWLEKIALPTDIKDGVSK